MLVQSSADSEYTNSTVGSEVRESHVAHVHVDNIQTSYYPPSASLSPLARGNRVLVIPKSSAMKLGHQFMVLILDSIVVGLLFCIVAIPPGHPRFDLLKINVCTIHDDFAENSAVAIHFVPLNLNGFLESQA